ncbi:MULTISPECIES: molybdopterin converting factor subunit 1 [Synechocystis]|uniref:Molybdopterin converting factor subunit 1 n=1 Tax=Synechocystis salina LEGE 00031 TaxID=1828736 RepID=A0ABR9VQ88_9SYNC|nr:MULTISPECIES: molybdopterin converting factor subunit 1 [Synechocystis]MBE9194635.1 molybdopterin converting factor subunit 1 [Synechocystis sp. LEGE 06083]MBE9240282.1 molybdopterin converting factor subunit 1 [Synechocystis salina LEGE 00041]MBE9253515.1 molybdopterin converting factor subunit 1 [Synechocystis salina LEGE 00031]
MSKSIKLRYFASLQEQAKVAEENLITDLNTYRELYDLLSERYRFNLSSTQVKVAVNDEFTTMENIILDQSTIVFIPPVAGG